MEIKKYKVVCSQPKFSDEIYIDIAPDSGVIHDQIFFSRIMLHRQISKNPLSRLYGSIYLKDCDGKISVEFPTPQARKDSPEYEGIMKQYSKLEPEIVKCYQKMRENGQESTLLVCSIDKMFELSTEKNAEADAFEKRRREKMRKIEELTGKKTDEKQKQVAQVIPQTPQEEQRIKQEEQFIAARERRLVAEHKRSQDPLAAWQRFQKQYSGD